MIVLLISKGYTDKHMKRSIKGFTLIELLVVISIIGVLATLLIINLNIANQKKRDVKRAADVTQIRTAIEFYYEENSSYPPDIGDATLGKYMKSGKVPKDPSTTDPYGYGANGSPRTQYQVWTELEVKSAALNSDDDLPGNTYSSPQGKNGVTEASTTAGEDCIFDVGSN